MAELRDVAAYLCKGYPRPGDLSNARLTKMVYLADWKAALDRGQQMTRIAWRFNHYGPYVPDVIDTVQADPDFDLVSTENAYGSDKGLVVLRNGAARHDSLTHDDEAILDHVLRQTTGMQWNEFIRFVYSTYPLLSQPRYSDLDLAALARRYQRERAAL